MKHVLVISGHTNLKESVANKTILETLEKKLPDAEIVKLDELYPDYQIDVKAEQEKLLRDEIENNKHDDFQDTIIVGYLEVLLNYCRRFYNRQFLTRKLENTDLLKRFESLLRKYFEEEQQLTLGLPTVQYCADKLCMSANYFGDLIKKSTGDTASHYIRHFVIQQAKNLLTSGEAITQVAYRLGFEYPQHFYFCRYEQRYLGITPSYMHFCDFSKIVCKKTKGSFWLFHYLCNRKQ